MAGTVELERGTGEAVVGHRKAPRAIRLQVRQLVGGDSTAIDHRDEGGVLLAVLAPERPLHIPAVPAQRLHLREGVLFPAVPQHRLSEAQTQRHLVLQGFKTGGRAAIGRQRDAMRPSPIVAMTEAAVVALHSIAEWIAAPGLAIERDLPGEDSVGVRRAGEAYPPFIA